MCESGDSGLPAQARDDRRWMPETFGYTSQAHDTLHLLFSNSEGDDRAQYRATDKDPGVWADMKLLASVETAIGTVAEVVS